MTKRSRFYQIGFFTLAIAFIGLCLFVGITAVQKSMKLNLGFQVNPSFECKIVYNGNTIFCNTTKNGESLVVGNGVSLSGNNLTLNQNFSGLGAEFTLTIHNYTPLKTEISVSGTGANGDTLTLDAYSSGTAPYGNITITATGTSATLTFAEWAPTISFELNNATTTILNGTKLPMSGDYTITITPTTGYLFTQFNVINISDGGYTWNNSTGVFTITDWTKVNGNISITVKAEVFRFVAYSGSGHTAPTSRDGTAYKYYCEFGTYPQSYVGTDASVVIGLTPTSVTYAYNNAVTFYADSNGVNKYALVGSNYYAFEPIRWVVLGVSDGVITFSGNTPTSSGTTLFNATNSNRLTLVDNRIKLDGAVANKLLFLSELALDNEYFGYYHYDSTTTGYCNEWKNTKCDVKRFLNDTAGATGTTTHQATFATISGLSQYYDTSSTHVTGKYIQQTQIEKTSYYYQQEATDNGYYNMFLLGSNRNYMSSTYYYNWTDSYNIASYFPICTGTAVTALKGNVTPFAVANGANASGGSATDNTTLGSSYWWLRSGDFNSADYAYLVFGGGAVNSTFVSLSDRAVRPSFVLNLA